MNGQLQQIKRLVDDLADLSRIEKGKVELRREWVDVTKVVRMAVDANRPLFEMCEQDQAPGRRPGRSFPDRERESRTPQRMGGRHQGGADGGRCEPPPLRNVRTRSSAWSTTWPIFPGSRKGKSNSAENGWTSPRWCGWRSMRTAPSSKCANKIERMVDDLADLSRIEKGKVELRREWVDVTKVVRMAVDANRPLFEMCEQDRAHGRRPGRSFPDRERESRTPQRMGGRHQGGADGGRCEPPPLRNVRT